MQEDRDYTDPKCWEGLLDSEEGTERVAYSDKAHEIRIPMIVSQMDSPEESKVFDIACGLSYLDSLGGPFKQYTGMDFCEKSLAEGYNLSGKSEDTRANA